MVLRLFRIIAGYALACGTSLLAQDRAQPTLQLAAPAPQSASQRELILNGPANLSVVLSADERTLRITAHDGALVTVPEQLFLFADARAVLSETGEVATILSFAEPITISAQEKTSQPAQSSPQRQYLIKGDLVPRSFGMRAANSSVLEELVNPRTSTVLGDAIRVIATVVDMTSGIMIEEPKLSDTELIRRLSAEVLRLRAQITLQHPGSEKYEAGKSVAAISVAGANGKTKGLIKLGPSSK